METVGGLCGSALGPEAANGGGMGGVSGDRGELMAVDLVWMVDCVDWIGSM